VNFTNIWDIRDGARVDGNYIFDATTGNPDLDFRDCYFGDGWDGAAAYQGDHIAGGVNVAGWEEEYQPGADEPVPDDVSEFDIAMGLMSDGDFEEAVPYFWQYIESDGSTLKIAALQRILWCVYRSGGDLGALKEAYLAYADEELLASVRYQALDLAGFCSLYQGNPAQAADELSDLRNVAPSQADSLVLEMDIAYAEMLVPRQNSIRA